MKRPFFTLEGCDGVGKTTIRNHLIKNFKAEGVPCGCVGQHSWLDVWASRLIVEVREQRTKHSPNEIAQAYLLDKRQHAEKNIKPACKERIIISDRYIYSDAVYQEVLYGLSAEKTLNQHFQLDTLQPQAIIYIETDIAEAYNRILNRSKHARHYERPADMKKIVAVYNRILFGGFKKMLPPIILFKNDSSNICERVEEILMPQIRAFI